MKSLLALTILLAQTLCATETAHTGLRIVCFGDSITGPRPGEEYLHAYVKWPDLLQLALESRPAAPPVQVLNRGWAGDKVAAGTPRPGKSPGASVRHADDLLREKPDIAVILLGGNDAIAVRSNDPAALSRARQAAAEGLAKIVSESKAAGIRVLLLTYPEPAAEAPKELLDYLDDFNDVILGVAQAQDVPCLDLGPAFKNEAARRPLKSLLSAADGAHLAPYGEIVVAREVARKLDALGWLRP